ncbi:MAG TPA: cyclodeaminase/cyclohydrolase family protein [Blastocatellia bacterium]|jgi:formiminotetrahydrofolate cyclodeaminase|nr:cyclodeaminase/cyclohydrolase family protein [Blastocatellia bacterium]
MADPFDGARANWTGTFAELVEAGTPTPGGGSVAAYSGRLAAALGRMMCNITIGKKKYVDVEPRLREINSELERLSARLEALVYEDAESFEAVLAAYRLPKEDGDEKAARDEAVSVAGRRAIYTPYETARSSFEVLKLLAELGEIGNQNALSDVTVGAQLALVAVQGALYNVAANLGMLKDEEEASGLRQGMTELVEQSKGMARQLESKMMAGL